MMHTHRILIVDDESDARSTLRIFLEFSPQIKVEIAEADSVINALKKIKSFKPDIVLLDILLQDDSGFDLLDLEDDLNFAVIFTTAYDEFAIKAFKYNAVDYLLKPINPVELEGAIQKAVFQRSSPEYPNLLKGLKATVQERTLEKIALPNGTGVHFITLDDILYLKADGNYTEVFLRNSNKILVTKLIKEFEDILKSEGFIRTHKSYIVNIKYAKEYCKKLANCLVLEGDISVPVARRKKEEVLSYLMTKYSH